jgi:crotonobetaine/carnitine-CoA ligase
MTSFLSLEQLRDLPLESRAFAPIFKQRMTEDRDRAFLRCGGRSYTYGEFGDQTLALARGLADIGIGEGSIVPIALHNCAEYVMAWFALHLRGATMALLNPGLRGRVLAQALTDCAPQMLIASGEALSALAELDASHTAGLKTIIEVNDGKSCQASPSGVRILKFDDLLLPTGPDPVVETRFDQIQSIFFTSGSTGPAKGVLMPNAHFFANPCSMIRLCGLTRDDVVHTSLPLFHGVGSRQGVLPAFMLGAQVDLGAKFSGSRFWDTVRAADATVALLTPTMPPLVAAQAPSASDRNHKLRAIYNVAPDPAFEERFGLRMYVSFAITEIGVVIYTPFGERRVGYMGRAHEDWQLAVVDEYDRPVADGESGELVCRPRRPFIMMQGYLNRPEAATQAWRNLWYHTGDYMTRDADGWFRFTGRNKDRIRRRGENISPLQIEDELRQHPAVIDCVALGYPAGDGEDDVRILTVLRTDSSAVTPSEIADWLAPRLPASMVPRFWEEIAEFPLTPTGKVDRQALRDRPLGSRTWTRN